MKGIIIDYELKRGYSSRFNQKMFGRISSRNAQNGESAYYIPGVLDEVPHCRIYKGRIFIGTTGYVDFDPILEFCSKFQTSSVDRDEEDLFIKTGRERWKFHAIERGYKIDWE